MTIDFSPEQYDALQFIDAWFNCTKSFGPKTFYLAGYAGTGKTTIAKEIAKGRGQVCFAAFTGKAASVLAEKSCPNAMTIHRLIYKPKGSTNGADISMLQEKVHKGIASEDDKTELRELMKTDGVSFETQEEAPILEADLVIIDECSMISQKMGEDLESFGIPILYLGDPGQLPPVFGASHLKKRRPDYQLREIHRQAKESQIIRLATQMRKGNFDALRYGEYGDVSILHKADLDWDLCFEAGQIIAGYNTTRRRMNKVARKRKGYTHVLPEAGDKLICVKNDHDKRLLNGVTCVATHDSERMDMVATIYARYEGRPIDDFCDPGPFEEHYGERHSFPSMQSGLTSFDYGYAITCHKSQGSQWDHVVLCDDRLQATNYDFRKKWLYTAVTRAAKCITIYR